MRVDANDVSQSLRFIGDPLDQQLIVHVKLIFFDHAPVFEEELLNEVRQRLYVMDSLVELVDGQLAAFGLDEAASLPHGQDRQLLTEVPW